MATKTKTPPKPTKDAVLAVEKKTYAPASAAKVKLKYIGQSGNLSVRQPVYVRKAMRPVMDEKTGVPVRDPRGGFKMEEVELKQPITQFTQKNPKTGDVLEFNQSEAEALMKRYPAFFEKAGAEG